MKMFYTKYPIFQSVTGKLSWTHYCELLYISDDDKRSFYEKEAINANWSVRELKRQISSSLFERLLLSNGETNKKKVLELALKGNEIAKPEDIVKDPYVFEFLGLSENKPMMESDLEEATNRLKNPYFIRFRSSQNVNQNKYGKRFKIISWVFFCAC